MVAAPPLAPDWDIVRWFNHDGDLTLADLRGQVVVAAAFQMLCPGCVERTIPQLRHVRELFAEDQVAVIGLHTVFEHHEAMAPTSLAAFIHEYRLSFPVGVDRASSGGDPIPVTMARYAMRGTPTLLLIDRDGGLRRQSFGHIPDLQLGAEIMALVGETVSPPATPPSAPDSACGPDGCPVD
ncbi:MAG: redoxin family protein [Caulobacterales bacterium]|nr:redoxin family protein [Caulobacterales bacterium]